jgi:hypothetical protein
MLGPSPEASLAAPYLSMMRREALADQVNSAMLCEPFIYTAYMCTAY